MVRSFSQNIIALESLIKLCNPTVPAMIKKKKKKKTQLTASDFREPAYQVEVAKRIVVWNNTLDRVYSRYGVCSLNTPASLDIHIFSPSYIPVLLL